MSKSHQKARLIQCPNGYNPEKSPNFGVCFGKSKRPKHRTRCFFFFMLRSCAPSKQCMRLFTQSPKVGVAESAPSAAAPSGVQLQPLINWMLRFQAGNPRESHHLRKKSSQMKTSASPALKRGSEGAHIHTHTHTLPLSQRE